MVNGNYTKKDRIMMRKWTARVLKNKRLTIKKNEKEIVRLKESNRLMKLSVAKDLMYGKKGRK